MPFLGKIIFQAVSLLLIFYLFGFVHESGHVIFSDYYGVEHSEIRFDATTGFRMTVSDINNEVVRASGGFFSAMIMVVVFGLLKSPLTRNLIVGVSFFMVLGLQVSQGLLEWLFYGDYIRNGLMSNLINAVFITGGFFAFAYIRRNNLIKSCRDIFSYYTR